MTGARLRTAFFLTGVILVVEVVGGVISGSLALLSDAGHVLTDIVALGLAWFATVQAQKPADARNTYGYHRIGILAALINAATLILIVGAIAFEAVRRLQSPQSVTPWLMFVAASVGVIVNLYIGFGLRSEGGENLNVRAAMLHVFGDIGASAAVIVGGVIILLTRWYPADPIVSLAIAALIAWGAWSILRETVDILLEATPRGVNLPELVQDMGRQPGVQDVHDLHVWALAGGKAFLSAHVQVDDGLLSERDRVVAQLTRMLQRQHSIGHATLQLECAGCASQELYCAGAGNHDHCEETGHGDGVDLAGLMVGRRDS